MPPHVLWLLCKLLIVSLLFSSVITSALSKGFIELHHVSMCSINSCTFWSTGSAGVYILIHRYLYFFAQISTLSFISILVRYPWVSDFLSFDIYILVISQLFVIKIGHVLTVASKYSNVSKREHNASRFRNKRFDKLIHIRLKRQKMTEIYQNLLKSVKVDKIGSNRLLWIKIYQSVWKNLIRIDPR